MKVLETPNRNFDVDEVYRVEEIEGNEEITHQSTDGEFSKASRRFPKLTRYFVRNSKGEPRGYVEEKKSVVNADEVDYPTHQNTNYRLDNPNAVKYCRNHFRRCGDIRELDEFIYSTTTQTISNYTLDYIFSHSTPSDQYGITQTSSLEDYDTKYDGINKPHARLFSKDPNERLKNLFTVIKSKEVYSDEIVPTENDVALLQQTKGILVNLIDKELQRIQMTGDGQRKQIKNDVPKPNAVKSLKLKCIRKIEEELEVLKKLNN